MNDTESTETGDGRYRCRVCGREFDSQSALEHHVRDAGLLW